jgi:hypothetical protein
MNPCRPPRSRRPRNRRAPEHDPEKLEDFSDEIMPEKGDPEKLEDFSDEIMPEKGMIPKS